MPDRVLIAHPDPEERARLGTIVRTAGFDPVEAGEGEAALAAGHGTALAFLAPGLPGLDGFAVAQRLREDEPPPAIVLLNDVYPSTEPKEKLLRDFSLAAALPAPATTELVARTLFSLDRSTRRGRKDEPKLVELVETPLVLLLARARRKGDSGFLYARRGGEARFLTLVRGDIALARSNRRDAPGEEALVAEALLWTSGEAVFYADPDLEATLPARVDLLPLLETATREPMPAALVEAAERSFQRSGRVVYQPLEGSAEIAERTGLTLYEREVLALVDGERSVSRISGLAELGGLPLARLLLRLEATGVLARRRPGSPRSGVRSATAEAPSALLPHANVAPAESGGSLGPSGLARLLVRLEIARATGVLAVRRDGRTVEMALRDGRVTGSHAWGGANAEEDPVARLATMSELRPEDLPFLRRLHAQKLVVQALAAADCEWTFRKGEVYRMAETLGANPGSMVAELLRSGVLEPAVGGPPARGTSATLARALALTHAEASELAAWTEQGTLPERLWLRAVGSLLDPTVALSRAVADSSRALPQAPAAIAATAGRRDDLEAMFDRALDEGLREGQKAGAPRADEPPPPPPAPPPALRTAAPGRTSVLPPRPAREPLPPLPEEDVPDDLRSFELALGEGRAPVSFTMEQRAGGLVIRVGDKEYAIDLLIREVEELRRERVRMRAELVRRHNLMVEREDEVEAVRKTVHELENFMHELQATLADREATLAEIDKTRGTHAVELAELRAVLPEKDRLLEEAMSATDHVARELERVQGRLKERERSLEELRRERDAGRSRLGQIEAELQSRVDALRDAEERVALLKEREKRLEQDLAVARAERDDLTSRISFQEGEKKRRGFFRDARAEKAAVDERVEKAEQLAEERRKALEAVRKEGVSLQHRVLDLEGQVARRETELGRFRRERERIEERLAAAQAEAAARAETESAARTRRDEVERLLSERSHALDRERAEVARLAELSQRVEAGLAQASEKLARAEAELTEAREQRGQLRELLTEAEAELNRLTGELRTLREERDRLDWSLGEARQTSDRASAALAAVTAARDTLEASLAESRAARQVVEEEREQLLEESCRVENELGRARAELDGLRAELVNRDKSLQAALAEIGKSREHVTSIEKERDEVRGRAAALDTRSTALDTELQGLRRQLEQADAALAEERHRTTGLADALARERAEAARLDEEHEQARAALAARSGELLELVDRLQREKAAADRRHAEELARSSTEARAALDKAAAEARAALTARDAGQQRALAEAQAAASAARAALEADIAELRSEIETTRQRIAAMELAEGALRADLESRASQIVALRAELGSANQARESLVRDLEGRLASKVAAVQKLEGDLVHLKAEATRIIAAWKDKVGRLEERIRKHATDEIALREALATREATEQAIQAELRAAQARREEAETRARERLKDADLRMAEAVRSGERQKQTVAELEARAADLERRLGEAKDERRRHEAALSNRDGEAQSLLQAERERSVGLRTELAHKEADLTRLGSALEAQKVQIDRLEGQMTAARKRVAQDVRRISELVAMADDLKLRLGERDNQIRARDAELARRQAEVDTFREAAADKEKKLGEARDSLFSMSQHDRELSQQLAEQEELIANLKAEIERRERERRDSSAALEAQASKAGREARATSARLSELGAELERARDAARQAETREREQRARVAREAAQALAAGPGAGDPALARLAEAQRRIADLESELAARIGAEAAQRQDTDAVIAEMMAATQALDEAQGEIERLGNEVARRQQAESGHATALQDLTRTLAERERELASRRSALAGQEASLAARETEVARLSTRMAELEAARQHEREELEHRLANLEQAATAREEAYALLDDTLSARERLVEELERRLATERERATESARHAGAEAGLRAELEKATRALAIAAAERDARAGLRREVEKLSAERDLLLRELERARAAHPATAPAAPLAARAEPRSGAAPATDTLAATTREKEALIEAANQAQREATRLREAMERKAAELARLEGQVAAARAGTPVAREQQAVREATDEELHALQANLGVLRVKMADLNRQIVEKNRIIQRLIEEQGGSTPARGTPRAAPLASEDDAGPEARSSEAAGAERDA